MKKRTLVCFLIFTLCVFYTAIPNTVFGQEDGASLAKKVFDNPESKKTLLRDDVRELLPSLLEGLKESPLPIPNVIDIAINSVKTPAGEAQLKTLAARQGITLTDGHIALIKDPDVQTLLTNEDTKALLSLQGAELDTGLTELLNLVNKAVAEMTDDGTTPTPDDGTTPTPDDGTTPTPDDGTTPTPDDGTTPTPDDGTTPTPDDGTTPMPVASLAEQVLAKHGETLMRPEIQGGFLIVLDMLKNNPSQAAALNATTIEFVIDGTISLDNLIDRDDLTPEQTAALDQFLPLLAAKDAGVLALLRDPQVLEALKNPAAIDELTMSLTAPPDDGTTPTPDDGTTPTPDDGTTPTPDDGTTPTPDDGTTPTPDDGTTPTPDDGTTPTPDDGTTPTPDDGTTPTPDVETPPPPVIEQANPFDPIMPTDESLKGKSQLGGLLLNRISGQGFVAELFERATRLPIETLTLSQRDQLVRIVVEEIAKSVPKEVQGLFPKNQILSFLRSNNVPIFAEEFGETDLAEGLANENFGNAIMPMPLELIYDDRMGDTTDPNRKYLTRDSLNLFVRVPSADIGGVTFRSSDGTLQKEGQRVGDPMDLGSEIVPYTFRLEETLAATNLPAWPALENENEPIFSRVILRYSNSGLERDDFTGYDMQPTFGPNGVVWETSAVKVTQGNNYYYFEVELAIPLTLKILHRSKLQELAEAAADGNLPGVGDIVNATTQLNITEWAMPDPRNLQIVDRGILEALFGGDFSAEFNKALGPIIAQALSGPVPLTPEAMQALGQEAMQALGKHQAKLQRILLDNANREVMRFEGAFDPMLASVFSIPKIDDPESESLWVASFDDIGEGNYFVGAVVHDADGNPLDQMWSDVTVDTKAPEADVEISAGDNTVVYKNDDDVYVATASAPGAATLKVTGKPKPGMDPSNYVGEGYGYLFYQIVGLNPDGTPYLDASSLQRPNTWMPLIPESTMLASTIWEQTIAQLVDQGVLPEELGVGGLTLPTKTIALDTVLGVLNGTLPIPGLDPFVFIQDNLNPALKTVGDLLNMRLQLDNEATQRLVDVFGAIVNLINHVPITYGDNNVMMLAQIDEDILVGNYGIRAMGIDTLFNVSSHTEPTRLRIVDPDDPAEMNRASITKAESDTDGDGMVHPMYETKIIYANTKSVMITGTVTQEHPVQSIVIQYKDAGDNWVTLGEATVMGTDFEYTWNVDNFDALIGAGETVMVRAKATNALRLEDSNPEPFSIKLDAGIYPPTVLTLEVDITDTNPDSGAAQGMVTITATTPPLTGPRTVGVRFVATQGDGAPIELGTVTRDDALVDAVQSAVDTAVEGADAPINTDETVWPLEVDTETLLPDTITKDSPAARDASKDDNPYTIRAFAVSDGKNDWASDAMDTLSVDNVDDVGPPSVRQTSPRLLTLMVWLKPTLKVSTHFADSLTRQSIHRPLRLPLKRKLIQKPMNR